MLTRRSGAHASEKSDYRGCVEDTATKVTSCTSTTVTDAVLAGDDTPRRRPRHRSFTSAS